MSILIDGMDMPTEGGTIIVYKIRGNYFAARAGKDELFPFVPVSPHGRLIDADALIEDLKYDVELDAVALDSMETVGDERRKIQDDKDFKQNCIFWIEDAPTIIEAEEAE